MTEEASPDQSITGTFNAQAKESSNSNVNKVDIHIYANTAPNAIDAITSIETDRLHSSKTSSPIHKVPPATYRGMIGIPPPTDPKTIQPRKQVVLDIYNKLTQDDLTTIVLTGIGGVGKSTIAALVYDYTQEQYHNSTGPFTAEPLWLQIDAAVTMTDLVGTISEMLSKTLPDLNNLSPQNQAAVLFNLLSATDKTRLIVLDQFENLLDGQTGYALLDRPGVGEWLDTLNGQRYTCRFLLTSRLYPRGTREYPPTYMQEYHVKGLEIAEGIELLRKQKVEASETALIMAINRCEGHALALTLLASLLRRNRSLKLTTLFNDSVYTRLWRGDIAYNLLDYIYMKQLNETQQKLLLAFSIYREAVPLEAAEAIFTFNTNFTRLQLQHDLNALITQHMLQTVVEARYQLHPIVADYVQDHFIDMKPQESFLKFVRFTVKRPFQRHMEGNEQAEYQTLQEAHTKAALYYLHQAEIYCPQKNNDGE